jgi:hypothetical protein
VVDKYFISPETHTVAVFILVAYIFNFLLWKIGIFTGRKCQGHIYQLYDISYIFFSAADKNLANDCSSSRNKNILSGVCYIVVTFLIGILASVAADFIFKS